MAGASALVTLFFTQQEYIMSNHPVRPLNECSTSEQVRIIKGIIHEMLDIEDARCSLEEYALTLKRWRVVYSTFMLAIEEAYQEIRERRK